LGASRPTDDPQIAGAIRDFAPERPPEIRGLTGRACANTSSPPTRQDELTGIADFRDAVTASGMPEARVRLRLDKSQLASAGDVLASTLDNRRSKSEHVVAQLTCR
jgi:hypothetical protein